jgi:hypothetical protein
MKRILKITGMILGIIIGIAISLVAGFILFSYCWAALGGIS